MKRTGVICTVLVLVGFVGLSAQQFAPPPPLPTYTFIPQSQKLLPGDSTQDGDGYNCGSGLLADDQIGNLGLLSQFYQNGCYSDGTYNHRDYLVRKGEVVSTGGERFPAYRIEEPRAKADEFLASHHFITYRFPTRESYAIYTFDAGSFAKVAVVPRTAVVSNGHTEIPELDASEIVGTATYVFVPESRRVGGFATVGDGVEAATIVTTDDLTLTTFSYQVGGRVPDTGRDFPFGPATHANVYGQTRQFELVQDSRGRVGAVWQDIESWAYRLAWFDADLAGFRVIDLPRRRGDEQLAAVTSDGQGNIYYLGVQAGNGAGAAGGRDTSRDATLYKTNSSGRELGREPLDTSPAGLNIVEFADDPAILDVPYRGYNGADLEYSDGRLGLILSRSMHKSSDGLNHQGAIAAVFDSATLQMVNNHGQTSGHSFDNVLVAIDDGEFVGIDLGDNYPRGVNLHRFSDAGMNSRVVFTFKTEHGSSPSSPAGGRYEAYSEISDRATTFYQWSNDNRTYSELAGVVDTYDGFAVVFVSEHSPTGKALDNSRVGDYLIDSRNIGMVRARPSFRTEWSTPNVVTDDLVLSSGRSGGGNRAEEGGFYTFGGEWQPQRNTGVVWLTDYREPASDNATRVKVVELPDSTLVILWERWTAHSYVDTHAMRVSAEGEQLSQPLSLGPHLRLHRRDDPIVIGDAIYLTSGSAADGTVSVNVIEIE